MLFEVSVNKCKIELIRKRKKEALWSCAERQFTYSKYWIANWYICFVSDQYLVDSFWAVKWNTKTNTVFSVNFRKTIFFLFFYQEAICLMNNRHSKWEAILFKAGNINLSADIFLTSNLMIYWQFLTDPV